MTYGVQRNSATELTIAVRTPYAELEPLLSKAAAKISEATEIEGFRKGKAPYEVVKQKVGGFKILEEAARLYIQSNFEKILEDVEQKEYQGRSFEPVGEPQIVVTKLALPNFSEQNLGGRAPSEEFEFKITLSLLPAIELPDYKAVARRVLATKKVPETSEQEVTDALEWLRESRAKLVTVNRGAKVGDRVEIDFSATMGGVRLEGGESKNHPFILGKSRFVPGFEDALIGMKAGEEKEFTSAVPPDYRDKSVAGKALEFKTKVNLVQEREVPAWDDAFAKSIANFDSAAAVERSVRDGLRREKEEKERERIRMAMIQAVADETKAEIPAVLIERELEKMVAELHASIADMGLKFEDYLAHIGKSADELKREWRGDAERRVKIALLLREIAKRERIEPSEENVRAAVNRTAAHRGMDEENIKSLDREAFSSYHTGIARNEKVFQWLEGLISE